MSCVTLLFATLLNHERLLWSPLKLYNIVVLVDHHVSQLLWCPQRPVMSELYCRVAITTWNYCWTWLCSALVSQCSNNLNIVALLVAEASLHSNGCSTMPHHASEPDSGFPQSGLQRKNQTECVFSVHQLIQRQSVVLNATFLEQDRWPYLVLLKLSCK